MLKYILICLTILIITGVFFTLRSFSKPLTQAEANDLIEKRLAKLIRKNPPLSSAVLTIARNNHKRTYAVGNAYDGAKAKPDDRFHSASIGKTFTVTLTYMLQEEGLLHVTDKVSDYLTEDLLENLFVYEGTDYSRDVTIQQLISHTSGAADYFEDKVLDGPVFKDLMMMDTDRYWSEDDLLDFTRNHQAAIGMPGKQFHYSDTGYILVGKVLEAASGQHFHDLLHQKIFNPLSMKDSYLMHRSKAALNADKDLLPIYLDGVDLRHSNVLSIDWSGGGIVTTTEDLLVFFRAYHNHELISEGAVNAMTSFDSIYDKGIYYGQGLMQFRLGELSFLLRNMPNIYGGVGSSGSYMIYDPDSETYYIFNLGSIGMVEKGVSELIQIMMIYGRINE